MQIRSICTSRRGATFPLALSLLAASIAPTATAQSATPAPESYRAKAWSTASGLPQNTINDLLQTPSGELWIATFGGLLRFDGLEFKVFDLDALPGLPSNRITALCGDGGEGLWLSTQAGHLVHLVRGRIEDVLRAPGNAIEILSLARASDGSLWTQASNGAVCRFARGDSTLVVPPGNEGQYEGLSARADGTVGAAIGTELAVFDAGGARTATLVAPARILALAPERDRGWWVGLPDGLAHAVDGSIERVSTAVNARISAIAADGGGGLWLGTPDGPSHFVVDASRTARARLSSESVLPSAFDVRSIFRDREGDVWIGSSGQGLVRLRPMRVQSFVPPGAHTSIGALAEDGAGGAWAAVPCRGLVRIRAGDGRAVPEPILHRTDEPSCAQSLLRDRRGRVWMGWNDRVLRREAGDECAFAPVLGDRRFPLGAGPMVEAKNGDVWIAARRGHLVRVGAGDAVVEERDVPAEIVSLAAAPDDSVWIGCADRVLHVHESACETFDEQAGVPRGEVRDLLPAPDGSVWIATYGGGLGLLRDGRAVPISRAQGLADNSLSRILDDGDGRLWILSNLGLLVADRDELIAVAERRKPRIDPIVLGPETGVPEGNFGSPAGFRDPCGRLWFGTTGGVVSIDPREFPFNRVKPRVDVERLEADDAPIALSEVARIPAGTRRLVVRFASFALSAPERVHFRYRLDGFDADWNESGGERDATYTALAPGAYTFRVAARNEDGVWSDLPTEMRWEVMPLWWQTLSFRIGAVLAASAALILLHRLRIERVHRRAEVLLQATEARAHAEERESRLRDALAHAGRASTAGELATSLAHEVNQPLAAIVANAQAGRRFLAREPVARQDVDDILRDIAQQGQRASEVIRRLREFLRKNTAARRVLDVNQAVRDALPLVRRELEENRVRLALELASDAPEVEADPVQLQQVLVNLIKNSCEAMAEFSGERGIIARTSARGARALIEVSDTGPGLAPEVAARLFEPYVTTKPDGMGLGLAICRSIVEAHGGKLLGTNMPGGGVVFRIEIPVRASGEATT